ncbi:hypothetical protein RRG08_063243 [Elysia crispata]|uniref:Uncharacterized protein n=1 Tax=Elysia crispata TaxID=231223 RepID=A0AAE1CV14_9GAST|nr:hypothetical protein RRG08_063243 [Elysia crispata]
MDCGKKGEGGDGDVIVLLGVEIWLADLNKPLNRSLSMPHNRKLWSLFPFGRGNNFVPCRCTGPKARANTQKQCQQETMETIIIRRRWRWIGHVLRKEQDAIPRVAVQWRPEGHRKRGRPKTTWRRTVEAEAAAMGQSWGTLRMLAQDREQWKEFVAALIAYGKKGSK